MKIDDLAHLADAKLLTIPAITSVDNYVFDCHKVKTGDVYFALDRSSDSINIAVQRGAYAIFFDCDTLVTDKEIAWIKTKNIETSMIRIMRFISNNKKLNFVFISRLQKSILKNLRLGKNTFLITNNIQDTFISILKAKSGNFLFSTQENLIQKISPSYDFLKSNNDIKILNKNSLFQSSFIHNDTYYSEIEVSPVFLPSFAGILDFLNKHKIQYQVCPFKPIKHFEPIFIDKNLGIHPFGSTSRALIIESELEIFELQVNYFEKYLSNIDFLTCAQNKIKTNANITMKYNKISEILTLNPKKFRYALILGNLEKIKSLLGQQIYFHQPSLPLD